MEMEINSHIALGNLLFQFLVLLLKSRDPLTIVTPNRKNC